MNAQFSPEVAVDTANSGWRMPSFSAATSATKYATFFAHSATKAAKHYSAKRYATKDLQGTWSTIG